MEHVEGVDAKEFSTRRAAKGGHARAASLSPEERSESARRAVNARWTRERGGTLTVTTGTPGRAETKQVEITNFYHDEPLVNSEVRSWNVNSHSFVISGRNYEGSYTR